MGFPGQPGGTEANGTGRKTLQLQQVRGGTKNHWRCCDIPLRACRGDITIPNTFERFGRPL
jgi:hypothetical protein